MRYLNGIKTIDNYEFDNESIYEVIRREDGVFMFLEDHLKRLENNLKRIGKEELLPKIIEQLSQYESDASKESVMLVISSNDIYITDIFVNEISDETRRNGVDVGLYEYEREHPDIKLYRREFKKNVSDILKSEDLFEVLLISNGEITEGSRSNFYYIIDGVIFEPESRKALPGIVKKNLTDTLKKHGIQIIEKTLFTSDIDKIEGAFLSGTGMDVTVIKRIGEHLMIDDGMDLSRKVQKYYFDLKEDYKYKKKAGI